MHKLKLNLYNSIDVYNITEFYWHKIITEIPLKQIQNLDKLKAVRNFMNAQKNKIYFNI